MKIDKSKLGKCIFKVNPKRKVVCNYYLDDKKVPFPKTDDDVDDNEMMMIIMTILMILRIMRQVVCTVFP